ncbi:MAG: RHS repeat protein [Bradyrhizobiaceae bacterium]|nr:RHS repeat protein [Bradyrhizobiaceae bacterium]
MIEPYDVSAVNPTTLFWETVDCPNDSFPNYQVQIVRLFNYDTTYQYTDSTIKTKIDWTNALTVETYGPQMDLTLTLSEGTGFYAWRVRPIGNMYPNSVGHELNWGCWSTAPPNGLADLLVTVGVGGVEISGHEEWEPCVFYYEQFDDTLNWNHVRTWVEGLDGRPGMGELITYANGLGRPRQVQVFDHQTDNILASVTAYDFEGRGQLTSMSAPISTGHFGYRTDVFDGSGGAPYRASDFDVSASTVGTAAGSISSYWSGSNPDTTIPSAEGYPFSRSLVTADPLGEPREESGPGSVLKINAGHTTLHYLASPADKELVSIFGDEAPDVASVLKKVTVDPNGVSSVAYVDHLGRTIATCLERKAAPPAAMLELDDNDSVNQLSMITSISKGISIIPGIITNTKTFLLADAMWVRLDYSLKKQTVDVECAQLCFSCDYETRMRLVNDVSGAELWSDTVLYIPTSCSPENDSLVMETDSIYLTPGRYRMERAIRTALPDTTTLEGENVIRTKRDKHVDSARALFYAEGQELIDSLFGADQIERYYNNQTDDGKLQDTMLAKYLEFYAALDVTKQVSVGACCTITLPQSPCATGCGDTLFEWEDFIYEKWGTVYGTDLEDYFWVGGDTTEPTFDYPSPAGSFDTLIKSMVVEGGYSCADLWGCFEGLVQQFDRVAFEELEDGTIRKRANFDFYERFLACAGKKLCNFSTTPTGPTGYRTRGWKYYYADTNDTETKQRLYSLEYNPSDTTGAWFCGQAETDSLANINHLRFYRTIHGMNAEDVEELADSLDISANPFEDLCDPLTVECMAEYAARQSDTCKSICQMLADRFKDSVIAAWHRKGYWVEGDAYDYRSDPKINDTISISTISCLSYGLQAECEAQCKLTVDADTLGVDSILINGIGTEEEIEAINKIRFNAGFSVSIADTCTNPADISITRKQPASLKLAEELNYQLQQLRQTMQAEDTLWDYSALWASLVFELPYTTGACPPDSVHQRIPVYKYGNAKFVGGVIEGDSSYPDQCYLIYEYDIPQPQSYNLTNQHPMVGWLNDYLDTYWGMEQSQSVVTNNGTFDSCRTNNVSSSNYYTWYGNPDTLTANDSLLWQWEYCAEDGDTDSVYCDAIFPCVNGTALMPLDSILQILSVTKHLFRMSPSDTTLRTAGQIKLHFNLGDVVIWLEPDSCISGSIDSLQLRMEVTYQTWEYKYKTTISKTELTTLLNNDFSESVGKFAMNDYGQLVFVNLLEDTYTDVVINGINFDCSDCLHRADTLCMSICDSVECGTMCFRWLAVPDSLHTWVPKRRSCAVDAIKLILNSVRQQLDDCERNIIDSVTISYNRSCATPDSIADQFRATYGVELYHYTLYYYDRAGKLVQTVPPKGVHPLQLGNITRLNHPNHTFKTTYRYNTLGQLTEQTTPDGGTTKFWYNAVGQLRLSQNARQQPDNKVSYTNYDGIGRVIEVGQATEGSPSSAASGTTTAAGEYRVITKYTDFYDLPEPWDSRTQRLLDNRISRVQSDRDGDTTTLGDLVTTYYSYDPHGNVEWLVNELPGLTGTENRQGVLTEYEYDLISGKVIRVAHQPGRYDEFRHHYRYDHDSRLVSVSTSRDSVIWDEDARYEYYPHGPLRRLELGQDSVQGIDYTYTIHGWLKGINTPSLDSSLDVGHDGHIGGEHEAFAKDAFGMILGYHTNDFVRSGSQFASGASWSYAGYSLYNGNIGTWTWNTRQADGTPLKALAAKYRYDVLNRIRYDSLSVRGSDAWGALSNKYGTSYAYDPNGNILALTRRDSSGNRFDDLTYTYPGTNNKLTGINDTEADNAHPTDLDDQIGDSFYYDETGNFVGDEDEIELITWTPSNKIDSVKKRSDTCAVAFQYDAMGNRVVKRVYGGSGGTVLRNTTWYSRDVRGKVVAVYSQIGNENLVSLSEITIHGNERLGLFTLSVEYIESDENPRVTFERLVAKKLFELSDQLNNVRLIVRDVLEDEGSGIQANVYSSTDYYPYGMQLSERTYSSSEDYRYGYGRYEKDEEIAKHGNYLSFEDYGYDPLAARRWSPDREEKKFAWISCYAPFNGNPMYWTDKTGKENIPALLWAAENMANKNIVSDYEDPYFGSKSNIWTYKLGTVPDRAVCYESCFMAYLNSGPKVLGTLKSGFTNRLNAFFGRSHNTGGMNWFKNGNGSDRKFETDMGKGELGDIVFMGEAAEMEGHSVLLASDISFDEVTIDGKQVQTATFYSLSTSSDTQEESYGGRTFTFIQQEDGSWKQQGGHEYTFRGFGQMKNIKTTDEQRQKAMKAIENVKGFMPPSETPPDTPSEIPDDTTASEAGSEP